MKERVLSLINLILDDPYTLEQLMSPRINVSIVRPLTDRLYDPVDVSMGKLHGSETLYISRFHDSFILK
jgi:hypothetical protein